MADVSNVMSKKVQQFIEQLSKRMPTSDADIDLAFGREEVQAQGRLGLVDNSPRVWNALLVLSERNEVYWKLLGMCVNFHVYSRYVEMSRLYTDSSKRELGALHADLMEEFPDFARNRDMCSKKISTLKFVEELCREKGWNVLLAEGWSLNRVMKLTNRERELILRNCPAQGRDLFDAWYTHIMRKGYFPVLSALAGFLDVDASGLMSLHERELFLEPSPQEDQLEQPQQTGTEVPSSPVFEGGNPAKRRRRRM